MTIQQKSKWFAAATLGLFLCMVSFHAGRLMASQVTLRSSCDLTSYDRDGLKADWYQTVAR